MHNFSLIYLFTTAILYSLTHLEQRKTSFYRNKCNKKAEKFFFKTWYDPLYHMHDNTICSIALRSFITSMKQEIRHFFSTRKIDLKKRFKMSALASHE